MLVELISAGLTWVDLQKTSSVTLANSDSRALLSLLDACRLTVGPF
jgi:hypothetical protein